MLVPRSPLPWRSCGAASGPRLPPPQLVTTNGALQSRPVLALPLARPRPTHGEREIGDRKKVKKFLIVGVGGSGGATLRYLMDQLREDLRGHGIEHLPGA